MPRLTAGARRRILGERRRINDAELAARTLGEEFFDDTLSDMEAKARLQESGQVAAEIIIDIERVGPLARYAVDLRGVATNALKILAAADPTDAVHIAEAQAEVREYLRLCHWIRARQDDADDAEKRINEQYGLEHATHADAD